MEEQEPGGRYRTIVAGLPWQLDNARIGAGGRRSNETRVPYSFMSNDEIAALPVRELAAPDCALFLWSTRKMFREGEAAGVARAWGFEPCG
ncbi:MAG: S-adenosylmethionine-binding domain-containing protein, partial [Gemmatimonadaceae bacterium]|nr:S-adenosylmethionine-binding domain-containing protein [Gemmatimonadaceae bacterium]